MKEELQKALEQEKIQKLKLAIWDLLQNGIYDYYSGGV